jgi:8-oxo-dGTP pyrophosphatase MutT (NUDIX family)
VSELPTRLAARVLLLDDEQRVLLLRGVDPSGGAVFWFPPGGGIEASEDAVAAAVREVWEETGLENVRLDGELGHRRHRFRWGDDTHDQLEYWFLARVANFEPAPAALTPTEQHEITEYRWWTLKQMDATSELLTPRALPELLRTLLREGLPSVPLDLGI